MKIIVDSSLLFSSLIKPDGKISEIFLNPLFKFEKYTCYFLYVEIFKHKERILELSKLQEPELLDILYRNIRKVEFVNEERIPSSIFQKAYFLTKNIDPKDTPFVALTMYLKGLLWTSDKPLYNGLKKKNFNDVLTTKELLTKLKVGDR